MCGTMAAQVAFSAIFFFILHILWQKRHTFGIFLLCLYLFVIYIKLSSRKGEGRVPAISFNLWSITSGWYYVFVTDLLFAALECVRASYRIKKSWKMYMSVVSLISFLLSAINSSVLEIQLWTIFIKFVQQSPHEKAMLPVPRQPTWTKFVHPLVSLLEHKAISLVGPPLQQKQKSSRVLGLQIWHENSVSLRRDAGMHLVWKVLLGAHIPEQVTSGPASWVSLWPHLAQRSLKLSEASRISAAMAAPSYPGTRSAATDVPSRSRLANWK